jgi:hypothetical protein
MVDCCHSGVFADSARAPKAPAMTDDTFGDGTGAEGQYVLTATDSLQYAYDGTGHCARRRADHCCRASQMAGGWDWQRRASPFDENYSMLSINICAAGRRRNRSA